MTRALVLHAADNVATLVDDAAGGDTIQLAGERTGALRAGAAVAFGHKIAVQPIAAGEAVRKYGVVIGRATRAVGAGEHVHVHNVEALRARGDRSAA